MAEAKRPPMNERYSFYISALSLTTVIERLETVCETAPNDQLRLAIRELRAFQQHVREMELVYQEQELEEFFRHPERFPHAVRTWIFDYRDNEIS